MEIYLVFVDAIQNSNKFWSAKVEDSNLTVQWGRVGYQAQTKVHTLANFGDSYISALNEYLKIVPTPLEVNQKVFPQRAIAKILIFFDTS